MVTHHFAKFYDHSPWFSWDITYLICRMILQDHIIKERKFLILYFHPT